MMALENVYLLSNIGVILGIYASFQGCKVMGSKGFYLGHLSCVSDGFFLWLKQKTRVLVVGTN